MSEQQSNSQTSLYQREPFDYKKYRNFYELLGGFVAVVVLVGIGVLLFASDAPDYWQNIYITGIGAVLTVGILDRQAEHRAERQRKEELILQMGSPDNGFAVEAVRLLRQKGWLTDGSLKGANLEKADLHDADLREANLQDANLWYANLQSAKLESANLRGAGLVAANLQSAMLLGTNLQGTGLVAANLQAALLLLADLQSADLRDVNLQAANLWGANLQRTNLWDANLQGTRFNESTYLPDGTYWIPDTDMARFTDPNHPNFWRSEDPLSPAYRGNTHSKPS
ncbi:MAG: pentapeptide repeat-containing protein [Anaerolineae bacterium]|nr:pentapeptide repeat-containing protein [Anaerolineae bacterium]